MKAITRFVGISSLIFVLSGCGGGGEDLTNRPRIRVHWPALGRSIQASPYANSIRITLPNAGLSSTDITGAFVDPTIVIEANRPTDSESEVVYTVPRAIKPGKIAMTVETFSQANQQGRQVQVLNTSVLPLEDGFLPDVSLEAGSGAIRSVSLSMADLPPRPPEAPPLPAIREISVGDRLQIFVNPAPRSFASIDTITWDIQVSENTTNEVLDPKPTSEFGTNYYFQGKNPGLVTLSCSILGVKSNSIQFRVVP